MKKRKQKMRKRGTIITKLSKRQKQLIEEQRKQRELKKLLRREPNLRQRVKTTQAKTKIKTKSEGQHQLQIQEQEERQQQLKAERRRQHEENRRKKEEQQEMRKQAEEMRQREEPQQQEKRQRELELKSHRYQGRRQHREELDAKGKSGVYFISSGNYLVKIGMSQSDMLTRIKATQTANADKTQLLAYIETNNAATLEKSLHQYFNKLRVQSNREWFLMYRPYFREYLIHWLKACTELSETQQYEIESFFGAGEVMSLRGNRILAINTAAIDKKIKTITEIGNVKQQRNASWKHFNIPLP